MLSRSNLNALAAVVLLLIGHSSVSKAANIHPSALQFGHVATGNSGTYTTRILSLTLSVQGDRRECVQSFSIDGSQRFSLIDSSGAVISQGALSIVVATGSPQVIRVGFGPTEFGEHQASLNLQISPDCDSGPVEHVVHLQAQGACDQINQNCEPVAALCRIDANAEYTLFGSVKDYSVRARKSIGAHYRKHYPWINRDYELTLDEFVNITGLSEFLDTANLDCEDRILVSRIEGMSSKARFRWLGEEIVIPPKAGLPAGKPSLSLTLKEDMSGYLVSRRSYSEFFYLSSHAPELRIKFGNLEVMNDPILCMGATLDDASLKRERVGTERRPNFWIADESQESVVK